METGKNKPVTPPTAFSAELGRLLRDQAIHQVEQGSLKWAEYMRLIAIAIWKKNGKVCSDDLKPIAEQTGFHPHNYHAWGSVFKTKDWKSIGMKRSEWPPSHATHLQIFVYVGPPLILATTEPPKPPPQVIGLKPLVNPKKIIGDELGDLDPDQRPLHLGTWPV